MIRNAPFIEGELIRLVCAEWLDGELGRRNRARLVLPGGAWVEERHMDGKSNLAEICGIEWGENRKTAKEVRDAQRGAESCKVHGTLISGHPFQNLGLRW